MTKVKSLCVYCGSRGHNPAHREAAARLGAMMAERDIRLIYGGGRVGLMGVLADAVLAGGGRVTGIMPKHLEDFEIGHTDITEMIVVDSMHARKQKMAELADAFAILPGGLGTLDETLEIITWKQLGLHDKPVVVVDIDGYWEPLRRLIDTVITHGYAQPGHARLFAAVRRVEDLFEALAEIPEPAIRPEPSRM